MSLTLQPELEAKLHERAKAEGLTIEAYVERLIWVEEATNDRPNPVAIPRRGSAEALLQIAGRLQPDEADAILTAAQECRRIDPGMWTPEC